MSLAITTPVLADPSFNRSKNIAHRKIYVNDLQVDYYCGCLYNRAKVVDLNSCGYKIRKNAERAKRIEWEHVVPASAFGRPLECWTHGGRKNCEDKSDIFNQMEGDLHNLRPVIGEVNGDRSDLPYGVVGPVYSTYGQCAFKIDFQKDVAEPPDNIKGDLARISLFMQEKYDLPFTQEQINMFKGWANTDPVSENEKKINILIRDIQGDSNYYVDESKKIE